MSGMSAIMNVMQETARKASRGLQRDFGEIETMQISRKGPADFVAHAARKTKQTVHELLTQARPGYGFLMEDQGAIVGTDKSHRFIIDPINGKTNFLHGIPHFGIAIALEREIDGNPRELVAALVYNPLTDDMWFAEKGRGAYINDGTRGGGDRRLKPTQRESFSECHFATGIPSIGQPGHTKFLKELHQVMGTSAGVRSMGAPSLDLAWTAAGRYDGFWQRGLKPWEMAAGLMIAKEATLSIESLTPGLVMDTGDVIAGTETLLPMLKERVA